MYILTVIYFRKYFIQPKTNSSITTTKTEKNKNRKTYSLWDTYVHADFVTYPSIWEGWGNQLIEAIFAKKPVIIFEYPVYKSDLKRNGFSFVSLGSKFKSDKKSGFVSVPKVRQYEAAKEVIKLLIDNKLRKETVDYNFRLARKNYSYHSLKRIISSLFKSF